MRSRPTDDDQRLSQILLPVHGTIANTSPRLFHGAQSVSSHMDECTPPSKWKRRWAVGLLAIVLPLVLLAGCGGGSTSMSSAVSTTTGLSTVVDAESIGACLLGKGWSAMSIHRVAGVKAVGIATPEATVVAVVPFGDASSAGQVAQQISGQVQTINDGKTVVALPSGGSLTDADTTAIEGCTSG